MNTTRPIPPAGADGTVKPAHARACAHCPWRLANQGQAHPHGFYTKKNPQFLWSRLRRGDRMSCHPTDSRMAEFPGYENTLGRQAHECAGALILQQREADRFQEIAKMLAEGDRTALKRYRAAHPMGLTREGLAEVASRLLFGDTILGGTRMTLPNLNDLEVGYEPLGTWTVRRGPSTRSPHEHHSKTTAS